MLKGSERPQPAVHMRRRSDVQASALLSNRPSDCQRRMPLHRPLRSLGRSPANGSCWSLCGRRISCYVERPLSSCQKTAPDPYRTIRRFESDIPFQAGISQCHVRGALRHAARCADQFPKLDRWRQLLRYIYAHITAPAPRQLSPLQRSQRDNCHLDIYVKIVTDI